MMFRSEQNWSKNGQHDLDKKGLNAIQQLTGSSLAFGDGGGVSGVAGQVSVGKSDASERRSAQNLARRRLPVFAEEEPRLWTAIGMPPSIEDDASHIAFGIEARAGEHLRKLLSRLSLVIDEGV